jgi:hypothetical protein
MNQGRKGGGNRERTRTEARERTRREAREVGPIYTDKPNLNTRLISNPEIPFKALHKVFSVILRIVWM